MKKKPDKRCRNCGTRLDLSTRFNVRVFVPTGQWGCPHISGLLDLDGPPVARLPVLDAGEEGREAMTRTVLNGHLVVGGVEAHCSYCVFYLLDEDESRYLRRPVHRCARAPKPCEFPPWLWCGEFLPREPKEGA